MEITAKELRAEARAALRGQWGTAALTGFIAALFTGTVGGGNGSISLDSEQAQALVNSPVWQQLLPVFSKILLVTGIWGLVCFALGGTIQLGYTRYNLNLIDRKEAELDDLFSQFSRIGDGFLMRLLTGIFIFLWSLLLVIPGVIKSYSYAMTPYILYENPGMRVNDAITESRRVMDGNKWRLFCLQLSFIGWGFLCALPGAIAGGVAWYRIETMIQTGSTAGLRARLLFFLVLMLVLSVPYLFLRPYQQAAEAAFYRDLVHPAEPEEEAPDERPINERFVPEERDNQSGDPWDKR